MNEREKKIAENAIAKLAKKDGVTVEYVRTQMKIAMLNGLCSTDPKLKAYWQSIPCEGEVPTPEEFIIFTSKQVKRGMC